MPSQSQVSGRYQESIVSGFDVYKPEVYNQLINRYGDQGQSWFMTMKMLGFERPVASDIYYHYENELKNPPFKSAGIVAAAAAGASQSITISPDSLDAGNRFYPRLGFQVNYKGGKRGFISAIDITTPSAPVLTVKPIQTGAAYSLPAVAAAEELSIVSSAFAEGTGQPVGIVPGAVKRSNMLQIIKETASVTGSELTNQTWMTGYEDVSSVTGQPNSWFHINMMDIDYRIALQISDALLFGQSSDGSITDPGGTGNIVKMTTGLVTTMKSQSIQSSYSTGSFSVTNFDAIGRSLQREYSGNKIGMHMGEDFYSEAENALVSYLAATRVDYTEELLNSILPDDMKVRSKAIAVNFKSLVKNERKYLLNKMNEFSNRQTYGIPGSVTPGYGLFIPLTTVKDPKTDKFDHHIGCRYKALGGYSRKMQTWDVNGASGNMVTDLDVNNNYVRAHIGAHQMAMNQSLFLQPL